jgi:hypothetical protein
MKAGQEDTGMMSEIVDEQGRIFGQLALLYDCPHTATVVASRQAVVWHLDRESFHEAIDQAGVASIVADHGHRISQVGIVPRSISPDFGIFDVNLTDQLLENLPRFWELCKETAGLLCILSCYEPWAASRKQNGTAKVIPAISASAEQAIRIFFFDDNIEWGGREGDTGICNLRDAATAAFIDFSEGTNGFCRDHFANNTVVHHSSEYNNVLVQANILDAMEDKEYFTKILEKYSKPGEKIVAYIDVNSTILSIDSISSKDMSTLVLGTMFEFITMTPWYEFEYEFDTQRAVHIEKPMHLKKFAKEICKGDKELYDQFYTYENCMRALRSLSDKADLRWSQQDSDFSIKNFQELYERYSTTLVDGTDQEGLTRSWFHCFEYLHSGGHAAILNTFGMDSRKVIVKTVPDERRVLQMAVSFDQWGEKDRAAFKNLYGVYT